MDSFELVLVGDGDVNTLVEQKRLPGENNVGMVAWRFRLYTPECPTGRDIILIANDLTHLMGSFGPLEDKLFCKASERARELKVPRIYFAANSGARIGLAEEVKFQFFFFFYCCFTMICYNQIFYLIFFQVKAVFRIAWEDDKDPSKGFKYLYLTPDDYARLAPLKSIKASLIEDGNESRYRITDVIGKDDGLGVENLKYAGLIAGETSQAYKDVSLQISQAYITCYYCYCYLSIARIVLLNLLLYLV